MEQIDDLQNGYFIIQKTNAFKFGVDAVLLADFAEVKMRYSVIDFCTVTGIIPILLYAKKRPKKIVGIELQTEMAEMASRSVVYNHLEHCIRIFEMNLKNVSKYFGKEQFDAVTVNPPYMKVGKGICCPEERKALARFEIACTLEDVIVNAREVLKQNGRIYMVHRADRLIDVITVMKETGLEPKRLCFVHPSVGKRPNLLLIEGIKRGRPGLKLSDPIYVYNENGTFTEQIETIYGRRRS